MSRTNRVNPRGRIIVTKERGYLTGNGDFEGADLILSEASGRLCRPSAVRKSKLFFLGEPTRLGRPYSESLSKPLFFMACSRKESRSALTSAAYSCRSSIDLKYRIDSDDLLRSSADSLVEFGNRPHISPIPRPSQSSETMPRFFPSLTCRLSSDHLRLGRWPPPGGLLNIVA